MYHEVSPIHVGDTYYKCLECWEEYPLSSTLVSEDGIRTFAELNVERREKILKQLNHLLQE